MQSSHEFFDESFVRHEGASTDQLTEESGLAHR